MIHELPVDTCRTSLILAAALVPSAKIKPRYSLLGFSNYGPRANHAYQLKQPDRPLTPLPSSLSD